MAGGVIGGMLGGGSGAQLLLRLKADAEQAIGEFRKLDAAQRDSSAVMRAGALAAGAAIGAAAVQGVRQFADLDTGMREVFTLMPGISQDAMDRMTEDVRGFAVEYGMVTDDVVPALYQAISAGVPPENVMSFMATAAQTARGGVTDLETAMDGLTSVVNAYGPSVLSAQDASDTMFTAVRLGKTTIGELSDSMFQVVPIAAASGVAFDQVAAALATMTSSGVPTRVAATNLRGALVELGKEGTIAFDNFEAAAGQTFPAFIAAGGTVGDALNLLSGYAEQNGTTIQNMFGAVEAGMAATVLSSESGSAKLQGFMEEMANRAGATQGAFEMMAGGVGFSFDQMKAQVEGVFLDLGEALMPAVEALAPALSTLLPVLGELITPLAEALVPVIEALAPLLESMAPLIGGVASAIEGLVPLIELLGTVLGPVFELLGSIVGGLGNLIGTMLSFESPVDRIIGEMLALRAGFADGTISADEFRGGMVEMGASVEEAEQALIDLEASLRNSEAVAGFMVSTAGGLVTSIVDLATAQAGISTSGAVAEEEALAGALQAEADAAATALENQRALADERRKAIDPLFAMVDAEAGLIAAQAAYNALQGTGAEGTAEYEAAVRELLGAQGDYDTALYNLAVNQGASIDAIRLLGEQAGLSEDDIADLIRRIEEYNRLTIADKYANISIGGSGHHVASLAWLEATGGMQYGGTVPYTGVYTVGEAGPETVVLPGGAGVIPHGGRGPQVVIQVAGSVWASSDLAAEVERQLVQAARRGALSEVY